MKGRILYGAVAALLVASPNALAAHLDESGTLQVGCLAGVRVSGATFLVNCMATQGFDSDAPDGGTYQLSVAWTPVSPDWAELQVTLRSTRPMNGGGMGGGGMGGGMSGMGGTVHESVVAGASPLALSIPTNGDETAVEFSVQPALPPTALLLQAATQAVDFHLVH